MQRIINPATGLSAWEVDENSGTSIQTGPVVSGDGVVLTATPAPSTPSLGQLKLYSPDGVSLSTVTAKGAATALPPVANQFFPTDQNLIAWSYDPQGATSSVAPSGGVIQLVQLVLRGPATVTNVLVHVATGGSTLTAGQNFAGLYDTTGARLGVTADQTTPWTTAGLETMALTSPVQLAAGMYYVALVANGTTPPAFARSTGIASASALINAGLTAATARFATNSSGQTSLPSTVTLASNSLATTAFWVAVS